MLYVLWNWRHRFTQRTALDQRTQLISIAFISYERKITLAMQTVGGHYKWKQINKRTQLKIAYGHWVANSCNSVFGPQELLDSNLLVLQFLVWWFVKASRVVRTKCAPKVIAYEDKACSSMWSDICDSLHFPYKCLEDTIFKKSANFCKPMRWKLLDVIVVTIFRVIRTYGYDFVIFLALWRIHSKTSAQLSRRP